MGRCCSVRLTASLRTALPGASAVRADTPDANLLDLSIEELLHAGGTLGGANLLWRVLPDREASATGRNLLRQGHLEFVSKLADVVPTGIERSVAAKSRWTF